MLVSLLKSSTFLRSGVNSCKSLANVVYVLLIRFREEFFIVPDSVQHLGAALRGCVLSK
jgi:hypothetical protein